MHVILLRLLTISLIICRFSQSAWATDRYVNLSSTCANTPCYTSIQAAIAAAADGDDIYIEAGVYQENLVITKGVRLIGAGTANTIIRPAISNIGNPTGTTDEVGASSTIILVQASNVSITNLTLDGENPLISNADPARNPTVNGATIDARNGIVVDYRLGTDNHNNLLVDNVVVKNFYSQGIYINTASLKGSNTVRNSTFENIQGAPGVRTAGVHTHWTGVSVENCSFNRALARANMCNSFTFTGNTITNSSVGIYAVNSTGVVIENNILDLRTPGSCGIRAFQNQGSILIKNNQIRNCIYGIISDGSYHNGTTTFTDNVIDGAFGGYTDASVKVGMWATTEVIGFDPGTSLTVNLTGGNIIRNVDLGMKIQASNGVRNSITSPINGTRTGIYTLTASINDLTFTNVSGNYIELDKIGADSHIPNIMATNMNFDGLNTSSQADCFTIEDKILHRMDVPAIAAVRTEGLVNFASDQVFVTRNGTNTLAQRAFDNAPANWTINLKSGAAYAENIIVAENASLDHEGVLTLQGLEMNGAGKTLTLKKNIDITDNLTFTNGVLVTGANRLNILSTVAVGAASDGSHVQGNVTKQGNVAFVFPIGNGTYYRPVSITAPALASDVFMASYTAATARSITPATISVAGDPAMLFVSDREYWNVQQINGVSAVTVGINWRNAAISGIKEDDTHLKVAAHTATGWNNLGGTATITSGLVWLEVPLNGGAAIYALGSTNPATTLPLVFTDFTTWRQEQKVQLDWSIADNEPGTFSIERSVNGNRFVSIGTKVSGGSTGDNANYSFIDNEPVTGKTYYRIKWSNGHRTLYSHTSVVQAAGNKPTAMVYHVQSSRTIRAELDKEWKGGELTVVSVTGAKMHDQLINNTFHTINTQGWSPGTYVVHLLNVKKQVSETIKLVIH